MLRAAISGGSSAANVCCCTRQGTRHLVHTPGRIGQRALELTRLGAPRRERAGDAKDDDFLACKQLVGLDRACESRVRIVCGNDVLEGRRERAKTSFTQPVYAATARRRHNEPATAKRHAATREAHMLSRAERQRRDAVDPNHNAAHTPFNTTTTACVATQPRTLGVTLEERRARDLVPNFDDGCHCAC